MYCLYIQVVLLVMLLSAQDLFTCLAHIIYIHCLYIQVLGSLVLLLSAQDWFTCLANIKYIYIYVLLIYSGGASGHASVGAGLIYMSCTYYIYIYIHCLYIQVKLLVLLLSAQDLFTCLAHIYIYIHCLYIQVMLLVLLLSAQDLFTCLAHIIYIYIACIFRWCFWSCFCRRRTYLHVLHILYIYIYCLYIQVMLLVLLLSAQDLFTCLANLPHLYQWSKFTRTKIYTRARPGAYGTQVSCRLEVMWAKICLLSGM